jgi:catalase (peroxidase I)
MVDYVEVSKAIADLVTAKNCGPILIRLAWHDAGTFDAKSHTGGSRGCMRFEGTGEATFGANAGLDIARSLLQPIKDSLASSMSYSDFWALAGIVAVKTIGGPEVTFRIGRTDATSPAECVEEGRHPDGDKGADHLRCIFHRMGLTDKDIVALSGAHTVGMCHADRSGFEGKWTDNELKFDNSYFVDLLERTWIESKSCKGQPQFNDSKGNMMLISDLALASDPKFKSYVDLYAKDQEAFFVDFATSFQKLLELGHNKLQKP